MRLDRRMNKKVVGPNPRLFTMVATGAEPRSVVIKGTEPEQAQKYMPIHCPVARFEFPKVCIRCPASVRDAVRRCTSRMKCRRLRRSDNRTTHIFDIRQRS